MTTAGLIYIAVVVIILVVLGICIRIRFRDSKKETSNTVGTTSSHHQDDVFNISRGVQGQEQQNSDQDAYLSIDHITITNQMNKPNYDDAPPSYEEAMRIAIALSSGSSEVPTVVVVPKTTTD